MKPSATRTALLVLMIASGVACGGDDDKNAPTEVAGSGDGALDASCPADTPTFAFGPTGLHAMDPKTGVGVYLENASDIPPLYGSNDWQVKFTDTTGNPMPQANLTWACAFMPLHGHGSNPKMVENLGNGSWKLMKQNMAMQGGWEIRLWVDPTGGGETYAGGTGAGIDRSACTGPGVEQTLVLKACVPR
jgi:hypothetical protein